VTTGVDSLWHLDDRWNSAPMTESRRNAAASLLAAHPTTDVDDVLDFFETVGVLVHRQVLDPELAWDAYYWPLAHYWAASETYRQTVREAEGSTTWQELDTLVHDLTAIEARKRGAAPGAPSIVPTPAQTKAFLKDESELPPGH
jgi:hypothetical protein